MALPVKASIWFVICGALKDTVDILVTPVFTRILTTDQYGIYNVYNSWFQIVKILFTLYLFSEVFNVGLVRFEEDRDRFVSATLGFITTSVGIYAVVCFLLRRQISAVVKLPDFLIALMFVHVIAYVPYYCWLRRERFDYHYRKVAVVSMLYVVLQPLLGIIGILCCDIPLDPGHTRILAAVGVQIVIGLILYFAMMFKGRLYYSASYWKYSLKTGLELIPFNLSKVVLNQCDRIMINQYSGSGDTGIYSVAHSAAFVLQVVTESLDGAFVPWLYRKLKAGTCSGIKKVINGLAVLVAAGVLGIDIIAPEIMHILGSSKYYQGVYCIPALVYSVYLIFIYILCTNIELFYGRNIFVTISSAAGMIANIVLNAVFIPRYGFIAAGYTTLAGYVVICIGHFFFLHKTLKAEGMRVRDILDIRSLLLISVPLFAFTLFCSLLYRWNYVRWGFAALLLAVMLITGKKWINFIKDLKRDRGGE
ncbi:MAG: polysaccharide biosynthesis C-terminal domain-containing protein [Lachnospiraceae bacterium]|nr:polysaccharide biosynthesis C-terminal domain-containing protein [Lachnospiraceae bacterium]